MLFGGERENLCGVSLKPGVRSTSPVRNQELDQIGRSRPDHPHESPVNEHKRAVESGSEESSETTLLENVGSEGTGR